MGKSGLILLICQIKCALNLTSLKILALNLTITASITLITAGMGWAQTPNRPEISAVKISSGETIRVDGILDEAVWQRASVANNFTQREPNEGEPASEKTEVRVLYDDEFIYFGAICFDSSPELVGGSELGRDDSFANDDKFSILIDTFHDHRNGFVFSTNPLGTQFDALITDENVNFNVEWDEKWDSKVTINEKGWEIEIAIPFKSLRSSKSEVQTWGLELARLIRRKNEMTYWSGWDRDYQFFHVSQAGHLTDLKHVKTGLKLRVKPFAVGGFSQTPKNSGSKFKNESQVGIEDLKISLTSSLTADFTANPDFAQAEVDAAELNLTRFSLFFPEKREFFLEGAGIFDFGTERPRYGSSAPDLLVFFSRRIGLENKVSTQQENTPIPIFAGAKVTGDIAGFQFGAINMHTDKKNVNPQTNYGVVRVKKKLLGRSYIGGILTNKIASGGEHYNRVGGIDGNFVLFEKLLLRGFLTQSDTFGIKEKNLAHQGVLRWDTDQVRGELERTRIDENFNPEIGFVLRKNMIKKKLRTTWRPRPEIDSIRQLTISSGHEWFNSQTTGSLESRENDFYFGIDYESGDLVAFSGNSNYELLAETFQVHPTAALPIGSYNFKDYMLRLRTYDGRRASGELEIEGGTYYNGNKLTVDFEGEIDINKHFSVILEHEYNKVNLATSSFVARVVNTGLNYNLTNKLLTSTAIQYDNVYDRFLLNVRLNYIYRPGDDIFIVYNDTRDFDPTYRGFFGGLVNRTLMVKFNHSFDF